ncbi:MAG: hypothetical protein ABFS30_11545 [Pseudomonadota bacterium]
MPPPYGARKTIGQEQPAETDAADQRNQHPAGRDGERAGGIVCDFPGLHFDAGEKNQRENADMGDGDQDFAGGQTAQEGKRVAKPDHGDREHNAREDLAERSGLAQALGRLAEQSREDQQDKEFGKNVHSVRRINPPV